MIFIDENRVMLKYLFPLNEIVVDFYDSLKSLSSGYARWENNGSHKCLNGAFEYADSKNLLFYP